ncbi:MAG: hypothetical protein ACKOEQ_14715, partial [Verrucomicrobiota bacterium]
VGERGEVGGGGDEDGRLDHAAAHLAALTDHLDLDGNVLITNDPYQGVRNVGGSLTFEGVEDAWGLRVQRRPSALRA